MAEELSKLQSLHWNGVLTDAEFSQAKARLIEKPEPTPVPVNVLRKPRPKPNHQAELEHAVLTIVGYVIGALLFFGVAFSGCLKSVSSQATPHVPLNPYSKEFK